VRAKNFSGETSLVARGREKSGSGGGDSKLKGNEQKKKPKSPLVSSHITESLDSYLGGIGKMPCTKPVYS